MRILPVSYTQNNNRTKQSFNGKLHEKLISTINAQTIKKIKSVENQYSLSGREYTQDHINAIIKEKSDIIRNLQTFVNHFQDDFELRLMRKTNKDTGENNVFFALTHPKVKEKIKVVYIVDYDTTNSVSLDAIKVASEGMITDILSSESYIEDVHRHFKNYMIDQAEEQVRTNYHDGLIEELSDYISKFSQFTRNGSNNRDYVLNLLKAVHSEKNRQQRDQDQLHKIAKANSSLTKKYLGNIVS